MSKKRVGCIFSFVFTCKCGCSVFWWTAVPTAGCVACVCVCFASFQPVCIPCPTLLLFDGVLWKLGHKHTPTWVKCLQEDVSVWPDPLHQSLPCRIKPVSMVIVTQTGSLQCFSLWLQPVRIVCNGFLSLLCLLLQNEEKSQSEVSSSPPSCVFFALSFSVGRLVGTGGDFPPFSVTHNTLVSVAL